MTRALLPLCLVACAASQAAPKPLTTAADTGPAVAAPKSMYLRQTFDTDPSLYVGRFIPDGMPSSELDESRGMQTQCSRYIQYKVVGGGGVTYDELYNASTGASISAQIPQAATVSVGGSIGRTVSVKYVIDQKMVGYIADPDKYAACCTRAPDQCPAEYIGEFISGTGAVYYQNGAQGGVKVSVDPPGLDLKIFPKLEVKHGQSWSRSIVFQQPVYFGFKLYPNPNAGPAWDCTSETVPQSSVGYYFVGVSPVGDDEAKARDDAMLNARKQVVQFIGEQLQTGEVTVQSQAGNNGFLASQLASESWVEGAASGIASLVQGRKTCVEQLPMPTGYQFRAKTLAYVPNASVETAAAVMTGAVPAPAPAVAAPGAPVPAPGTTPPAAGTTPGAAPATTPAPGAAPAPAPAPGTATPSTGIPGLSPADLPKLKKKKKGG